MSKAHVANAKTSGRIVNVDLQDDTHRQAKAAAALSGVSLSNFVINAISELISGDLHIIAETAVPFSKQAGQPHTSKKMNSRPKTIGK